MMTWRYKLGQCVSNEFFMSRESELAITLCRRIFPHILIANKRVNNLFELKFASSSIQVEILIPPVLLS